MRPSITRRSKVRLIPCEAEDWPNCCDFVAAEYSHCAISGAFEDFLNNFKTTPEQSITHDLGNITIDEDELSDEYDFLDEDEDAQNRRRQERRERAQRRKGPHHKYKEILQDLSDRKIQEVTIDLDDLANVCLPPAALRC